MVFVEAGLFTRLLHDHLDDEEYRSLQAYLIERPEAGAVIRETGGARKVRWRAGGKGKSGGVRVIYYWMKADEQIFFLTIYGKSEKEDLTSKDLRRIAKLLEDLSNG
jgi:mRNA-degrading endonuclease RelE of RelBE toxin-antitoxin system